MTRRVPGPRRGSGWSAARSTGPRSARDPVAVEAETGDGVTPQEPVDLGRVESGGGAGPVGHGPRVGPGAVGMGVVGLEEDGVGADGLSVGQSGGVVEEASVD